MVNRAPDSLPHDPRKNDAAVDRMCGSIRAFGFKIACPVRSDGEIVDGHLRLKAARKLGITDVPLILCDEWTLAQVKTFRLMVNRSVTWDATHQRLKTAADRATELTRESPGRVSRGSASPENLTENSARIAIRIARSENLHAE